MNKIFSIILAIIVLVLIFFAAGAASGIFYEKQKQYFNPVKSESEVKSEQIIKEISSKIVPSMNAYGQVSKIDGRAMTLRYNGQENQILAMNVRSDAKVYSFLSVVANKEGGSVSSKEVAFEDIKIGDTINAVIKITSDGIEGLSLIIMPPAFQP